MPGRAGKRIGAGGARAMSIDSIATGAGSGPVAMRPTIRGTRHAISSGHYLATQAGFAVLEAGGNAIDAGVAAGLAMAVVQSEFVNLAGVAPIMVHIANRRQTATVSGLGVWPATASLELFLGRHGGAIPEGILRTVVPAAPDAWITALKHFGTMSFGETAAAAIRFAREGFAMYPLMAELIAAFGDGYRRWPANAAIYLPGGRAPRTGEPFVQADLARVLQHMADQERRAVARGGRLAGLQAAREAFYRGDIAAAICDFHAAEGGLLTRDDMAAFRVEIEAPLRYRHGDMDVYSCPPWCQGPALLQMLAILDDAGIDALDAASPARFHLLLEAMKLAFVDRERHYGDPRLRQVPMAALLAPDHTARQRAAIDPARARPHRELWAAAPPLADERASERRPPLDTSYVAVIDRHGNAFSATPSDVSYDTPVVPGTGLCPSSRGAQSWAVADHPAAVRPGARPRLTPAPAMAENGRWLLAFGTPGGDMQCQAMLQVLLNLQQHKMELQQAIEAPRVATFSFPDSFEPHGALPDRVFVEDHADGNIATRLRELGHDVHPWPAFTWRAGGVCAALLDRESGVLQAAADPRRPCYALGW